MITVAELSRVQQALTAMGPGPYTLVQISSALQLITQPEGPPTPPSGACRSGFRPLTSWWTGWCGDEEGNFRSNSDYGVMESNAEAVRLLAGGDTWSKGWFDGLVYFPTTRVPQGRGGLHILGLWSGHKALGTPIVNDGYPGLLRPDFETTPDGTGISAKLKIGTYNLDGEGRRWFQGPGGLDHVVDSWTTPVILEPGRWNPLHFEWERIGDKIHYNINGATRVVTIHPESRDFCMLSVGNMDDLDLDGGIPEVRFKQFRWASGR